ncbi:hypothetical protein WICPIJ_009768 [Wickerhamomyces pijperi]|uniref:Major facilitator superfamily (MFS) profile domain-containing protein n=1 Tax=Wickerhamomyces pijperi TaxID=599730 RepID=A0A9P8PJX3_WICPI|nr:hypothetical protein WICPIJ_009768 [Wickerhamomyces pijperi]
MVEDFTDRTQISGENCLELDTNANELSLRNDNDTGLSENLESPSDEAIKTGEKDSVEFAEGGRGWLVVFGCFFTSFTTFGMINAYGVFQSYYETVLFTDVQSFKLSVIGSCQPSIMYLLVPFVTPSIHACGVRNTLAFGASLMIIGLFGLSTTQAGELWKCYLFQAIMFSVGGSFYYPPIFFSMIEWFKEKRATAIGTASCGVGLGGAVWPLIFKHMLPKVGFHWTVRCIAFIYIPLTLCGVIFIPQRLPKRYTHKPDNVSNSTFSLEKVKKLPQTYKEIVKNWFVVGRSKSLLVLLIVNFLNMIGSYPAIFYLDLFATTIGPNNRITPYITMMYSFMGAPGRIIPAMVADKFGRINVLTVCILLSGALILAMWIPAIKTENMGLFAGFCVVFGFFICPLFSLFPACMGQMFGIKGSEDRLFLFFVTSGPGPLIGTLIAGSFIPTNQQVDKDVIMDSFIKLNIFTAVILIASGLILLGLRLKISRKLTDFI